MPKTTTDATISEVGAASYTLPHISCFLAAAGDEGV